MKKINIKTLLGVICLYTSVSLLSAQVKSSNDFKIYMVNHSHADLSWPDEPEVCTNLNVQAIKESIKILNELKTFKFSEEDVFVFQEFLRRYPSQTEEVRDLLQKNILECGAFYMGPSETLLGGEGLIRNIYSGKGWLKNKFGINTEFAWNVDEPGHTLQMPQILAKAGIKNFIIWKILLRPENNLNVTGYVGPSVFRWQSPDGSIVLVAHCPEGYSAGSRLRTDDFSKAEEFLTEFSKRQEERHNKWNQPPVILMAEGGDCIIPDPRLVINARLWNEKHGNPELKLATANEYFKAVEDSEQKGWGKIQTITGEIPCWWDGTQSVENDAFMLTRHAEYLLTTAEKFSAINDLMFPDYDYPQTTINKAWEEKLWVHEHNWGGTKGIISDGIKLAKAREMYATSNELASNTLATLLKNIRCSNRGIPLIVFNSLAWERTDIAEHVVVIEKQGISDLHLTDKSGNPVQSQIKILSENTDGSIARVNVVFEAHVPSLGYETYYLVEGKSKDTAPKLKADPALLENRFFTVKIDPASGSITSIFDKVNSKELLKTGQYNGNELIALENKGVDEAEEFTEKWWRSGDKSVKVTLTESGPVCATIKVEGSILNSGYVQEIKLYASLPRIDLKTVLDWDGQKEIQVNTTFPFKVEKGRITYEVPFGMVQYGEENPYSVACHPTVRATNNWVDISNDDMGVTLLTEVTPFDLKDRVDPRFHDARIMEGVLEKSTYTMDSRTSNKPATRISAKDPLLLETDFVIQPILLRSVFSCGDKNLYFTQKGEHPYCFSITTHKGALVPHVAVRAGWEHNSPLIVMTGQSAGGNLADSKSFLGVSLPNVVLSVLKKAEDGNGLIFRCYETDGKNTTINVQIPDGIRNAERVSIIEEKPGSDQFPVSKDMVGYGKVNGINIGKFAIETFRLTCK